MHSWRDELKAQLKRHEGFVAHGYQDSLGFLTIGYGRLIDAKRGGGISEQEASALLDNDIERVVTALHNRVDFFSRLTARKKMALANMAFQLGINGLLNFRKMLGAMRREDWPAARREALDSAWAKQTPRRAQEIANLLGEP